MLSDAVDNSGCCGSGPAGAKNVVVSFGESVNYPLHPFALSADPPPSSMKNASEVLANIFSNNAAYRDSFRGRRNSQIHPVQTAKEQGIIINLFTPYNSRGLKAEFCRRRLSPVTD